jgi:hypothetical protein
MAVRRIVLILAAGAILGFAAGASAQAPVAVVEDVTGGTAGVEFMDYLSPGKVIRLGPGDQLVLGYMKSCWRESIKGGVVTVGTEQSKVEAGSVDRARIKCNGGHMQLSAEQADKSGALSFRTAPKPQASQRTIHGLAPIVEVRGGGRLQIERVDQPGERHEFEVPAAKLLRGAFFDLAEAGVSLQPGGQYRVRFASRETTFRVAPDAQAGAVPIIARLVRLTP